MCETFFDFFSLFTNEKILTLNLQESTNIHCTRITNVKSSKKNDRSLLIKHSLFMMVDHFEELIPKELWFHVMEIQPPSCVLSSSLWCKP